MKPRRWSATKPQAERSRRIKRPYGASASIEIQGADLFAYIVDDAPAFLDQGRGLGVVDVVQPAQLKLQDHEQLGSRIMELAGDTAALVFSGEYLAVGEASAHTMNCSHNCPLKTQRRAAEI
jgi:hypothetical protein